ncbi:MAG: right-handed parallel beta-helix repeat-containing protein [Nitrosopumilus sp.]|nr:right-handed parallel beta-helix repeat-containing protein [Nitrosopumilus sp.]
MKSLLIIVIVFVLLIPTSVFAEISISDNGGDCSLIGEWHSNSKTCTLNTDTNENIIVNGNNITLDGNSHYVIGGNDNSGTIQSRSCISVDAKFGVIIKNFEIKNCAIGISFQDVQESTIERNIISENLAGGIHMTQSNDNIIKNNQIIKNPNGGVAINGNNNLIEKNTITDNSHLYLENELQGVGLSLNLKNSIDNIFRSNIIKGHKIGMNFDGVLLKNRVLENSVSNNEIGINLNTSEQFLVLENIIENNEIGISSRMYGGTGGKNTIEENTISRNNEGIHLESKLNILTKNTISNNSEYGLRIADRTTLTMDLDNKIFNNNFINNARHVFHGEANSFTVNGFGNYWNDFSSNCVDVNSDKICDEPYPFSSGTVGVVDNDVWVEKDGWLTSDVKEIMPISESKQIVCPQGFEPINGKCPDKPVIESDIEPKLGLASFVDKSKDPQSYVDRYNNEPEYKKWFDDNYPQYDSIEQAVGLELIEKIPGWVKNIFGWYAADQVSEDELLNAIKYLINEKILVVN